MFTEWVAMYDSANDSDYQRFYTLDDAVRCANKYLRCWLEQTMDDPPEDLKVLVLYVGDELVPDKYEPDTWCLWDQQWDCWYTLTVWESPHAQDDRFNRAERAKEKV